MANLDMADIPEMLRPAEAAVVAGVALRDVNDAIDRRILPEGYVARRPGRRVAAVACLFIRFYYGSAKRLTAEERQSAIREMSRRMRGKPFEEAWASPVEDWTVRDAFLQIDFGPFTASTAERWRLYRAARAMVVSSPDTLGGIPVIEGTRIPVHDVAASIAAGHSAERIFAAYPRLRPEQIDLAVLYAEANPPQGRPRRRPVPDEAKLDHEERVPRRLRAG